MEKVRKVELTTKKTAAVRQRAALYQMLASDEEYSEMTSYVDVDPDTYVLLGTEMDAMLQAKGRVSTAVITQVLQYDIQGYNPKLTASLLSLEPEQVLRIRASDSYKIARTELLNAVVAGARKYMEVATVKAVKTLVECLDSSSEKVRLAASQDLLNRAGLQAPTQIEITTPMTNFDSLSDADLAEIMKKERVIPAKSEVIRIGTSTDNQG